MAAPKSNLDRQRQALADDEPLHALWRLNSAHGAQLWMEFMAPANHRKAIRSEIASYAERFHDLEDRFEMPLPAMTGHPGDPGRTGRDVVSSPTIT